MNDTAPIKFGMGAPVRRKEDKALVTGTGHFTDDYTPEGTLRAYVVRSTMAHAKITRRRPRRRTGDAGRAPDHDRRGHRRHPRPALQGQYPPGRRHPSEDAEASAPLPRHRPPCRRSRRLHRRRDAGPGAARGRGDRDRLRSAAGGGRHAPGARGRRAAGVAGVQDQRRLHLRQGRQGRDRRGLPPGRAGVADRDRQQPPRRQLPGDPRRRRRIRRRLPSATR